MAKVPKKPRPDFPLTPCGNGQWRKVVNKKPYYFGSWKDDPKGEEALKEWVANRDAIYAGTYKPERASEAVEMAAGMSVESLIQKYLAQRSLDVRNKKLAPDTFRDYALNLNAFAEFIGPKVKAHGLKPSNFSAWRTSLEATLGPHALKRAIASVRAAFNFAMDSEWIDPIRFGPAMKAPDTEAEAVAHHHEQKGEAAKTERILTRKEVRRLLRAVKDKPKWKAMILVMLNTAMNPTEIARLKWSHINMESGRLSTRRGKSKGIRLECYLWKRTRAALEEIKGEGELVFTRNDGRPLIGSEPVMEGDICVRAKRWNKLTAPFIELCKGLKLDDVTPYTLRRTARTVAAHCTDDNAAKRMMGQRLAGRDQTYIKRPFPLKRLKTLSLVIHDRLFKRKPPKMRIATDKAA